MATYRKPLKDIDGNTIIPAMTGDQTEWVQTGDLADSAVTADKIDFSTMDAGFNRYVTTDQTATAGTQNVIKLGGSIGTDSGVTYNSNTGVFTIQKAGWWVFSGGVGGAVSAATTVTATITINDGADHSFSQRTYHVNTNWGVYLEASAIYKMSVGDTVRLICEPIENQVTAINNYARGHLVGTLIRPA